MEILNVLSCVTFLYFWFNRFKVNVKMSFEGFCCSMFLVGRAPQHHQSYAIRFILQRRPCYVEFNDSGRDPSKRRPLSLHVYERERCGLGERGGP